MNYKKFLLSVPLGAGLLLTGCGTDEQEPPPETEDVELENNHMEENNNEDSEMQDPGMNEESPQGEENMN
jgi:outer membrane biogenesis lipoprotein LolB